MKRLLPLLLLGLAACGPRYDGLTITLNSEPPLPVNINDTVIELPVGIAVVIDVYPLSSTRFDYYESDQLALRSEDRDVLRVEPTSEPRRFIVIGVTPGETCVAVEVDHDDHGCIPARVVEAAP